MVRRLSLYLLVLATVFLWGASFPITKTALQWLGPMGIAFVRWAISALALAVWLAGRGTLPVATILVRREGLRVTWIALTGITLYYALENVALGYTSATNAGILSNLTSVFIALLGTLWLQERITAGGWMAMGVAFAGAAFVSQGAGHVNLAGGGLLGDLMMVLACLFAAMYSIGGKQLVARYPADVTITVVSAAGALLLLPLALWEGLSLALPSPAWGALLLLGLGCGALGNLAWLHILSRTSAARAGTILFLIPIFSTALSVITLDEKLSPAVVLGGIVVLVSVAFMQRETT